MRNVILHVIFFSVPGERIHKEFCGIRCGSIFTSSVFLFLFLFFFFFMAVHDHPEPIPYDAEIKQWKMNVERFHVDLF